MFAKSGYLKRRPLKLTCKACSPDIIGDYAECWMYGAHDQMKIIES